MTISNNFFFRRGARLLRMASVLMLAGCALWLGHRVPVSHARTGAPANPPPELRGRGAVEYLKHEGLYGMLAEAINPFFAQETKLTASNGAAFDYFGSVAISGDTLVVGAGGGGPENQGAAYVFVRSGTAWNQQTILTASDGAAFDYFGSSVAIDGNTAVIGAPGATGPNGNQGAVYVFVRSGTTWTQQQKLTVVSDGVSDGFDDYFGISVAISGNTVAVGAPYVTLDNYLQGAAYVFARSGTTWTQQQKLTTSGDATAIYFGWSVAISGSTVAVAASCYDWSDGGFICPDSVYVYARSGTTWPLQQRLTTSDTFGEVAISGDTLVVGAYVARAAYVFVRSGTTWTLQQMLTIPNGMNHDHFGASVAISGNTLAVGAPYESTEGWLQYQGAAYVFARSGTTWTQQQKLMASDRAKDDNFASSIAISGGTAVAGVPCDSIGAIQRQGSAYVFAP
ncbi:MAG TPA: FG-GAP repeat protein [Blastocatellia bacterium]|nr:FG-GAP repeat protein [Blastocatellia bacterium]